MLQARGDKSSQAILGLTEVERAVKDMRAYLYGIGGVSQYLKSLTDASFREQREPDGTPWEALNYRYWKWKWRTQARRKARGAAVSMDILRLYDRLIRSVGVQKAPDERNTLIFGPSDPKGAWMQQNPVNRGRTAGPDGVPARPFLYLTDSNCERLTEMAAQFIGGRWDGASR